MRSVWTQWRRSWPDVILVILADAEPQAFRISVQVSECRNVWSRGAVARMRLTGTDAGSTRTSNKGMKQTKPSILELRSLSPVLDGPVAGPRNGRGSLALRRTNSRCLSKAVSKLAARSSSQKPAAHRKKQQLMSFSCNSGAHPASWVAWSYA